MQEESEIILHASYRPVIVSSESVQNRNEVSAILGGDSIYLRDDEDWPTCPTCSCALLPILHLKLLSPNLPQEFRPLFSHHEESSAPILQFLICSDSECFETTVIQEESAWLMRIISSAAADILCVNLSGSSLLSDRSIALDDPAIKENRKVIHRYLSESALFKPQTVITRWNQAKREMVDYEDLSFIPDVSDEFFEEHKPLEGVKLLGYPIKGSLFNYMALKNEN